MEGKEKDEKIIDFITQFIVKTLIFKDEKK